MDNVTTTPNGASFVYRLTLGSLISEEKSEKLTLEQGVSNLFDDEEKDVAYYVVLLGFKMIKRIYQPTEIEAVFDITQSITDTSGKKATTVPPFEDVTETLLRRRVKLEFAPVSTANNSDRASVYTIAENCFIHEVEPQLLRDVNGTKMCVKLHIFSMDKLMTLNQYSKAYVARKLGSGILKPESLTFGKLAKTGEPLVKTNIKGLRFLKYDEQVVVPGTNDEQTTMNIPSEFIQPYLVQYNESFYDFLVRTSNRCGEFLFFENGELTLGLPDSGDPVVIDNFLSVTQRSTSPAPLDIKAYTRDSMKDGNGQLKDLNQTVIDKLSTGYPEDAFPANTSSNAELANDEYIFPLYKDKFSKLKRENYYDRPAFKALNSIKALTTGTDMVASIVGLGIAEGLLVMSGNSQTNNTNQQKGEHHLKPYDNKEEQSDKNKVVQFSSLNEEGWTTIDYYHDIHKHEAEQQSKIICIDMGAGFVNVKLGQKISVNGMAGTYVIIQIQQDEMMHSLKIEAIPSFYDENDKEKKEKFIPPVEPVPVIRKSGPQTAFIADNEDPKYQGRVRVAYPWQSLKGALKAQLSSTEASLAQVREKKKGLKDELQQLSIYKMHLSNELSELKCYSKASKEKRQQMLEEKADKRAELEKDIDDLKKERAALEQKQTDSKLKIIEKEAEITTLKKDPKSFKSEIEKKKSEIEVEDHMISAMDDDISRIDKKITKKEQQIKQSEKEEAEMKAAAEEQGDKVIARKQEAYDKAVKDMATTSKDLEDENRKIKDGQSQVEKIKEKIDKDVIDMASPWIRVATPMATPGGGTFFRPQKGDEVLINFDNDNVERPYVVGSLFSKNTLEPAEGIERKAAPGIQFGTDRQVSMSIMSPNGHHITFSDPSKGDKFIYGLNPGTQFWGPIVGAGFSMLPKDRDLAGGIHIGDRYGVYEIEMSTHDRYINVKSPFGTVNVSAFTGINIEAPNGDINIKGKNVNIQAGNNLTMTSGTNITPEGIGDPDYKCGSWLWKTSKTKLEKVANFFLTGVQGIGAGLLWLGQQAMAAGPGAANEVLGPAAFADLSLFRHMFEIAVKPVEGTTLIKSKRYLKLEAGPGTAMIKAENFPAQDKIDSLEKFYVELIEVLNDLNERVNNFFTSYQQMWTKAVNASSHYHEVAETFLKDPKDPDIREKAFTIKMDGWDEVKFIGGGYSEQMKDEDVEYCGSTYSGDEKDDFFCAEILDYASKVYALHQHVLGLPDLLEDYSDDNTFKKAAKDAFKDYADEALTKWQNKYGDDAPKGDFAEWVEDLFSNKNGHRLFRRKLAAMYLVKVSESELNKEGKFLNLGFGENDIVDSKMMTTYNWKNMMTHFDHKGTFGNKFMIFLMDGLWEPIKKRFQNPVQSALENKIWAKQGGQILFSDNDGSTLHFNGAKLESETQSNLGNREQLLKVLLSL